MRSPVDDIHCPGCDVLITYANAGGYGTYCERCVAAFPPLHASDGPCVLTGRYPDFQWTPAPEAVRGFVSLQLAGVLGAVAVAAAVGAYILILRANVEAAAARAQVAEHSMHAAMVAGAAKQAALEDLLDEQQRVAGILTERERAVRSLRGRALALERQIQESTDEPDCEVMRARLCGTVVRLLRGDGQAAPGRDGSRSREGETAADADTQASDPEP